MKRSTPHLIEYKNSTTARWCVDYRVDGKRRREFFKTKASAEKSLKNIETKIRREGEQALSISDPLRIEAMEQSKRLEPYGETLTHAVDFFISHLEDSRRSIPIRQLVSEFVDSKEQDKELSKVYQDDMRNRFSVFCETFGDTGTRVLTSKQVEEWIFQLPLSSQSKENFRSRLGTLFNFAIRRGYIDKGKNPCEDISVTVRTAKKEILTVDQLRAVLAAASPDFLPLVAIGAFAGLRTEERVRLAWEDIDIARGFLTVGEEDSKTASRRTIKMEPCLQAWLFPYAGRTGRIYHGGGSVQFCLEFSKTCKKAGLKKAPKNGLRHSFASYHVGKYDDAERVRAILGHSTAALLYANYREMVHPDQATLYFNIFPAVEAQNVVSLTA
jgi:integrase